MLDSLGMHSSGATEDLKLRHSGYHSSPKESENNASVYIFWGGGEGGGDGWGNKVYYEGPQ